MSARFVPVELTADTSKLTPGDRKALDLLIEASRRIDRLFLRQLWSGNPGLYAKLQKDRSAEGRARLAYFQYCSLKNIFVISCFRAIASTRRRSHDNHSRRVFHTRS
ncbi:MAG: hypothetical protein FJW39_30250, partial [Acidobacteria bacterium]|nr:hypothetical protein [Acidobacteriota bacterium]